MSERAAAARRCVQILVHLYCLQAADKMLQGAKDVKKAVQPGHSQVGEVRNPSLCMASVLQPVADAARLTTCFACNIGMTDSSRS